MKSRRHPAIGATMTPWTSLSTRRGRLRHAGLFRASADEFYAIIGRIIMIGALIEQGLLALLWTLDPTQPQDKDAGDPPTNYARSAANSSPPTSRRCVLAVSNYSSGYGSGLNRRHDAAHNLWPSPTLDSAYSWRPVRPGNGH